MWLTISLIIAVLTGLIIALTLSVGWGIGIALALIFILLYPTIAGIIKR